MKILYGPPGTGKTWRAARDAVRLITPTIPPADVLAEHNRLVAAGQIIWVTFHPSYSYEDFVEGFRPVVKDVGITYRAKDGPFRVACKKCSSPPGPAAFFRPGQTITSDTGQDFAVVEVNDRSMVLRKTGGGKGTGQHSPISFWLVEALLAHGYDHSSFSIPGSDHSAAQKVADDVQVTKSTLDGVMAALRASMYHLKQKGWPSAAKTEPVVLVIDEINRADLSRVFGELITLLEPDKRIGASEERRVMLPYSQELFGIPSDLHIIGTMNTADRSLTLMDHALRRRFEFEEIAPDPARCASPYGGVNLTAVLTRWNDRITALLSRDHRIGHAYLMADKLERARTDGQFANDTEGQLRALALAVRRNIVPLLVEYFHDDWRKADIVFGRNFTTNKGGLLQAIEFKDIEDAAGEVVDLDDVTDFKLPGFWDPTSSEWNASAFRAALGA